MATIRIDDYIQLSDLCWNRSVRTADESEVLQIYESGWRFVDRERLTQEELTLINRLLKEYGNGVLNV